MVKKVSKSNWDAEPEIGEHEVRYAAYVTKSPKRSKLSPEERPFLPYGVGPVVDCEIDDDTGKPDYLSYSLIPKENKETVTKEQTKESKQTKKNLNSELSLDHVYKVIRELKLPTFQRIIKQNKFELIRIAKRRPDRHTSTSLTAFSHHIYVAKLLLRTIFNPVQKVWIYSQIREVLNIPPHEFASVKYVYTVLAPEVALMVLKNKFKCFAKICDENQLNALSLLNSTFFDDRFKKDLHCRT
ncbi:uncharacterized protein LOC111035342 isoform X2 [Myzus persicae]|uniref:uncharacterized protein LOC111035342 isoform X2 n=1 Tax=Myzus persicae TaxID=13164 RepID=UPI000B935A6C|nr:uncharacterized protein LOC111035342 isoform X2 [Myzus persicae]